jgi:hypothetical protein
MKFTNETINEFYSDQEGGFEDEAYKADILEGI